MNAVNTSVKRGIGPVSDLRNGSRRFRRRRAVKDPVSAPHNGARDRSVGESKARAEIRPRHIELRSRITVDAHILEAAFQIGDAARTGQRRWRGEVQIDIPIVPFYSR